MFNRYFNRNPSVELVENYVNAHTKIFNTNTFSKEINFQKIINLNLDVEAIEYVLRLFKNQNSLSCKHKVLSYLMEARSENFTVFHNPKPKPSYKFVLELSYHGIRSIWKLCYGLILCIRHKWFLTL
jgi:hypothetical protein